MSVITGANSGPCSSRSTSLHNYLTVHPGMRRADVVVVAWFSECDGLALALRKRASSPFAGRQRGRIMRDVASIAERKSGTGFDASPRWSKTVFGIAGADPDRI